MGIWEILFVVALVGGFLVPSALCKQWRLFFVFLIFFFCFGICEWLSVAQTGKSISQHFWIYDSAHPFGGWFVVGGMGVAWVALLVHFKIHKKQ